jgi:6-phosphogluconolactonase (cycloisomerase 2 family)
MIGALALTGRATAGVPVCAADCDANQVVTIDELVVAVNIALGQAPASRCASADTSGDGSVSIDELIVAVDRSLNGCSGSVGTPTVTMIAATPTATSTPTVTFTPTFVQPVNIRGACRIPAPVRRQPAVPCDDGTEITLWRCDERDKCLSDPATRTLMAAGAVGGNGTFDIPMDGARAAGHLMRMQAAISDAVLFQMMELGFVGGAMGGARAGHAGGVLEVDIDASSEAALRELNERGLGNFSDEEIAALITTTREEAVGGEVYGGLTADAAAERGRLIAASALEPVAISISPDGAHVYTANGLTDSITAYRRAAGGLLEVVEVYRDGIGGIEGLDGAFDVAVNPSGTHVYAAGRFDNSVVVFTRNAQTGGLTPVQRIDSIVAMSNGMPIELLDVPYSLAVSPDDRFVYVRGLGQAGFLIELTRNTTTGQLSFDQSRDVAIRPRGFVGKRQLSRFAASGDARNVYIEHNDGDGILTLERAAGGLLSAPVVQELRSAAGAGCTLPNAVACETLEVGLNSVTGFATRQQNVYVASVDDHALTVFTRDTAQGGRLARTALYQQGVEGIDGLEGPIGVTVTGDGRHLYVAAFQGDSVAGFARDTTTGALTFAAAYHDDVDGVDGLGGAFDLAASPDGANLYVVSSRDSGVAVFARDAQTGALEFLALSD